jgi:hypothetical protein
MRTKALLCAVALTAGNGISIAQSNVFTNVSVRLPFGGGNYFLIANPLNNTNNDITNLFRFASDADQIYRWNSVTQDIDGDGEVIQYSALLGWSRHFILQPGEAVFYLNAGASQRTLQFVGEVIQGPYTNPIPFGTIAVRGNGLYNAYGGISPVAGSFTNALIGLTPADGDQVYFWNPFIQDFDITVPTYSAFSQTWTPSTTVLNPGIGFFYLRAGPDQGQWIHNSTVQ